MMSDWQLLREYAAGNAERLMTRVDVRSEILDPPS